MNYDSHIIRYAKGWYKKKDIIEDLKILVSKRSGINTQDINESDVYETLLAICLRYCPMKNQFTFLDEALRHLNPNSLQNRVNPKEKFNFTASLLRVLIHELYLLSGERVNEVQPLDEVDPTLLEVTS